MKAAVFHEHGSLDNLRYEDFPDPEPGPTQALLRVRAVALNGFDPMVLRGIPGLKTPLPMVPGADIAGEIVGLGVGVDGGRWKIGDRVMVIPNHPDGMMGETKRGGCSDFVAIDEGYLLPLPESVSFVEAACLPVAYGTALRMIETRGQLQPGEKILILGASGGVGTCCVQLAKLIGCKVIACASSEWKIVRLKELGADHVINTAQQNYVAEIHRLYGKPRIRGGGGVDVVVNYTGGDSWAECFRTLKRHGRLLTCGATAGYDPKTDIRYIWSFEFNILGCNGWTVDDLQELLRRVADGRVKPVVHCQRPLSEIREPFGELMRREVFGKAVLIP
ncbi:MAG TPA: zinc-binding dehydrogenase [Alphaproteobacteria bacterium]|nr:zinc-binding dehydrogenase [Alphaproteobacteria bacterium]